MNSVNLMGRLTKDPELRQTPNGVSVCSFSIAVPKQGGEGADFLDCVAWRQTAENITKFFRKGRMIAVTGAIQTRTYTDNEGRNRKVFEILVNNFTFCGEKKEEETPPPFDDGDLPF